ncbi:hypothetical protein DYE49_02640 [Treponema rectale]|uniref:Leucine rich repeat-containing protein n=1 Tax=Treponema rectale TaxID=744512 RepID=A0A7M1XKT4_9SPIR|nr:hypothetical protein DYE49_02640 [Treponema rectale]
MSKLKFIKRVKYRKLLHDEVPLSFYDVYQDEERRYALLTFYNSTLYTIKSFQIKITFFTANKDRLNSLVFGFEPKDFFSHKDYAVKEPLLMPLEAEGFNYEILDVEIPTKDQNKKERLRIDLLPEGFDSRSFVTGKDVRFGNHKKGWLFLFASLMVAATGTIPYVITNNSARQYYFGGDSYLESFEFEGGTYLLKEDSTCVLEKINSHDGKFALPETVYHKGVDVPVTDFNIDAFEQCYLNKLEIYAKLPTLSSIKNCFISELSFFNDNEMVIPPNCFNNCIINNVSSHEDTIITVEKNAFTDCYGLKTLRGTFTNINSSAFADCFSLQSLSIRGQNIDSGAFSGCRNINSARLHYSYIAPDAFEAGVSYSTYSSTTLDLADALTC